MTLETEGQLLEAIKGGDRKAMRRFYDRFSGYAMATGLRYVADQDDVLDVVQDSFVKMFSSISRFDYRGEGSLKAWVSRIVVNQSLDYLKSHQRLSFVSEMPADIEDEEPAIERIPADDLARLITQLPTGYRLVLNLHVFEELPHKEIARRLGIRENTSASQYNRAKQKLAELIKNYLKKQQQ